MLYILNVFCCCFFVIIFNSMFAIKIKNRLHVSKCSKPQMNVSKYTLIFNPPPLFFAVFCLYNQFDDIYLYSHTAKYIATEKNNNIIIT